MPLHKRRQLVVSALSEELRNKFEKRSFTVRKGDEVIITRGDRKGEDGKVNKVDYEDQKVYIEGVTRKKSDKSEVMVPIHPSNLMITSLDLSDSRRQEALNRTSGE